MELQKKVVAKFNEIKKENSFSLFGWARYFYNFKMATKNYNSEVIAYTADIGQEIDKKKNSKKCKSKSKTIPRV